MKRAVPGIILLACALSPKAYAQTADAAVTFEVASIKPGAPPTPQPTSDGRGTMWRSGCFDGPGSQDPGRYTCHNATLASIVSNAYELKRYQYSFPAWMGSTYFEIVAKVPPGSSKEQFRLMKQNLLADRFKLAVHFEKKGMQVYELSVGKDGAKLKESRQEGEVATGAPAADPSKFKRDGDGSLIIPLQRGGTANSMTSGPNGPLMRLQGSEQTMEQFAAQLSNLMNIPITDATGLNGKYDITLTCAPPEAPGLRVSSAPAAVESGAATAAPAPDAGPTIFAALQQQLGLKLEPKKGAVDFLVIDHVEKTPVEN